MKKKRKLKDSEGSENENMNYETYGTQQRQC
jgi:hypothetical protein